MVNRAPGGENRASMKGQAKHHPSNKAESVSGIEDEHGHAGEKGRQSGVVFKLPRDYVDHSCVRTPEKK